MQLIWPLTSELNVLLSADHPPPPHHQTWLYQLMIEVWNGNVSWCSTPLHFQFGGEKFFCTFTIRNSLKTPQTHRNLSKSLYFCCMKSVSLIKTADIVATNVHRHIFTAESTREKTVEKKKFPAFPLLRQKEKLFSHPDDTSSHIYWKNGEF